MTLESRIEELTAAQRETNSLLRTLLAHAEGDRETLDRLNRERAILEALQPGTRLYGDLNAIFATRDYDLLEYGPIELVRIEGVSGSFRVTVQDRDGDDYVEEDASWEVLEALVKHTDPDVEAKRQAEQSESLARIAAVTARRVARPARAPEKPIEERVQEGWAGL